MHELLERGLAIEVLGPQCVSYILEDESLFNLSEYKILKNQKNPSLIDFAKLLYNGKIKLTYFLDEYVPLKSITPNTDSYSFISILSDLLSCVTDITHNGYLNVQNLNLELNRIYVKQGNCEVKLLYLPVNSRVSSGTSLLSISAVDKLRSDLVKLIEANPCLISQKTKEICQYLSNGLLGLDEVLTMIRGNGPMTDLPPRKPKKSELVLTALGASTKARFKIDKDFYILGRSEPDVDGCITFNPAVGRIHCRIIRTGSSYAVEDMNSKNGTYLNKTKLLPHQKRELSDGDVLRIANSDFKVEIMEGF